MQESEIAEPLLHDFVADLASEILVSVSQSQGVGEQQARLATLAAQRLSSIALGSTTICPYG
jgi:hypothetical protein